MTIDPGWVCYDCGNAAQPDKSKIFTVSTYHEGRCGVCGQLKMVTETRDFGYPDFNEVQNDASNRK